MYNKKKLAVGTTALTLAALVGIGGTLAYINNAQHVTDEIDEYGKKHHVQLVQDAEEISGWKVGDADKKSRIYAVNNGKASANYGDVYVRLTLKEYMDIGKFNIETSEHKYLLDANGKFISFSSENSAKSAYPANIVEEMTDVITGDSGWFIRAKNAGDYCNYVQTGFDQGDITKVHSTGADRAIKKNQIGEKLAIELFHEDDECAYAVHKWNKTNPDNGEIGNYQMDSTTHYINDFIKPVLGENVISLSEYVADYYVPSGGDTYAEGYIPVSKWIYDDMGDGEYVYWGRPLEPQNDTGDNPNSVTEDLVSALTLVKQPNGDFYYAIHADMEAVSRDEIWDNAPQELKTTFENEPVRGFQFTMDMRLWENYDLSEPDSRFTMFAKNDVNTIRLMIGAHEDNNYVVDWGDGSVDKYGAANGVGFRCYGDDTYEGEDGWFSSRNVEGAIFISTSTFDNAPSHSYAELGELTITIYGSIPGQLFFGTNSHGPESRLTKVLSELPAFDLDMFSELNSVFSEGIILPTFVHDYNLVSIPENLFVNNPLVTHFSTTFYGCNKLKEIPEKLFEHNKEIKVLNETFANCYSLTEIPENLLANSPLVTNFSGTFSGCTGLTEFPNNLFADTSSVTDMSYMFNNCSGLTELDVSNFDTSNVTNMNGMFQDCSRLKELDVSAWNTTNVTNMVGMFIRCSSLTELDVSSWDTSKITSMWAMFNECSNLRELDVSNFDTSNVTNMYSMFYKCSGLTDLDVSNFDTSKVTDIASMFNGCSNLAELHLGIFDTSKVKESYSIFYNSKSNMQIYVSSPSAQSWLNSKKLTGQTVHLVTAP